ncbi:MAG: hypothetical protein Q4B61_03995 [Bacteroidales bacterium]|jgi:hypothetical protein|nr:hypothetical protein [Paludibacteraceae bacterium]MBS7362845.1 hypothetical protein [Paludibacteraceae bacterium]MDO4524477.1 hypothetical protein [Bacteroidales bacterium]
MGILNYEIGGNERPVEASEAIGNIPQNRTLFVGKLTAEDPIAPETVEGLKTIDDVYAKFQPNVDVEFETVEGETVTENFTFSNTGDFQVKQMTEHSDFLKGLSLEQEFYEKLVKQLRTNKVLQKALENEESRQGMIEALTKLREELKESGI